MPEKDPSIFCLGILWDQEEGSTEPFLPRHSASSCVFFPFSSHFHAAPSDRSEQSTLGDFADDKATD